jgi:hypothetical protein
MNDLAAIDRLTRDAPVESLITFMERWQATQVVLEDSDVDSPEFDAACAIQAAIEQEILWALLFLDSESGNSDLRKWERYIEENP